MSETPRAQLIHIDVDRRLGHEWDEWDGRPLPNRGDYDSSPTLFFGWSAAGRAAARRAGGARGARPVPAPDAAPPAVGRAVRPARLGGERRGEDLQRAGSPARAEG